MMSNRDYTELIEQYVNGTISGADKAWLESEIAANPSLQGEVEFHKDMVQGLQNFRRAELKARLNNIPVEVGVLETLTQSTLLKVAASVGVTALVIGGIYYFAENSVEKTGTYERLSPVSVESERLTSKQIELKELARVEAPEMPVTTRRETSPEAEPVVEEVKPVVRKPVVKEFENEEEYESRPVADEGSPVIANPAETNRPVDIELKSRLGSENKLQYQFYEEKLYLYGDFGKVPYEILEINSKEGKKLYLYHQDVFYRLTYPTREVSDLERVTDEEQIKELTIFRETKALN